MLRTEFGQKTIRRAQPPVRPMPPTFLVVSYRSYDFPYDAETWNIAGLPHIGLTAHLIIRVGLTCGSCFSKMVCTMVLRIFAGRRRRRVHVK